MNAEEVAKILKGKRGANGQWACKCPEHEDKRESFTVSDGEAGILVYCFAGCDQKKLFLRVKKMYEAIHGKETHQESIIDRREVRRTYYFYDTETQSAGFKVERIDFSDGTKDFKQLHLSAGNWIYGRGDEQVKPYQHALWDSSIVVAIFEGEKCAERAAKLGIPATCIPGGAKAWRDEYKKYFDGKDVCIVPDNDPAGEDFAQAVYSSLDNANPFILKLPGLKEKEDIVEWIENGGTLEQFSTLAKAAKASPLLAMGFEDEFTNFSYIEDIQNQNSRKVIPFGIPFLDDVWKGILPDDLCVLSAKSGSGKTQMAMLIAKNIVSSGGRVAFFALEAFRREIGCRTIYSIAVDDYIKNKGHFDPYASFSDWISGDNKLRLAMKKYVDAATIKAKELWSGKFNTYYLDTRFTIEEFEKRFLILSKNVDLVILDHLHYIAKSGTQNSLDHLSEVMSKVKSLVNKYHKPVLMICHLRKEDTQDRKPVPDAEDLHGSSDIFKIATKVALIGRPLDGGYDTLLNEQITYMRIPKDRLGQVNDWEIAKMRFSRNTQKYLEDYEVVKLYKDKSKEWKELELSKKPYWFKRNVKKQEGFYDV